MTPLSPLPLPASVATPTKTLDLIPYHLLVVALSETLDLILHHLLPILLVAALSVKSFVGPWWLLKSMLLVTFLLLRKPLGLEPMTPPSLLPLPASVATLASTLDLLPYLLLPVVLVPYLLFAALLVDSILWLPASDPPKLAPIVAAEGNLPSHFLTIEGDLLSHFLSPFAIVSDASRRAIFEEGTLGHLLRLLDYGSLSIHEHTATTIEAITTDPTKAWVVLANNGIPILIVACRSGSGSPAIQALAVGILKSISTIDDFQSTLVEEGDDIRSIMVEEGAIPVLIDLFLSGTLVV